jgi:hypothetical protein
MRRRIEITAFEQERIVSEVATTRHCSRCGSLSELLTVLQAAALIQREVSLINDWVVSGKIHLASTPNGDHCVCQNSLRSFAEGSESPLLANKETESV